MPIKPLVARPKVAELVFQVYRRPLHPELFEVYSSRVIERDHYQAKIEIIGAGHVVTWRHQDLTLTEVATSAHHPLPQRRRLLSYRLRGQRNGHVECWGRVSYDVSLQLEQVDPEVFWVIQEELTRDAQREGMFHMFGSSGRMALGALSYIHLESFSRRLIVQAFHTFPDDNAIVKSQSLIEIDD